VSIKDKINEIKEFWRYSGECNETDCIVTIREMAATDINDLISIIKEQEKELSSWRTEFAGI
jgi:hypothetical protein